MMSISRSVKAAAVGGVLGALLMSSLMAGTRWIGVPMPFDLMLGSAVTRSVGWQAWLVGFVMQLSVGAIFGAFYGVVFDRWFKRVNWLVGAALGAVHVVASGVVLGFVPAVHPLMPDQLPAPGMFMAANGAAAVVVLIVVHLAYGAIVGGAVQYARRTKAPRLEVNASETSF